MQVSCSVAPADQKWESHKWTDSDTKLEFCLVLVWYVGPVAQKAAVANTPLKKPAAAKGNMVVTTKPGTQVCTPFNKAGCTQQGEHPKELHICSHCLTTVNCQCAQPQHFCRRKQFDMATNHRGRDHNTCSSPPYGLQQCQDNGLRHQHGFGFVHE